MSKTGWKMSDGMLRYLSNVALRVALVVALLMLAFHDSGFSVELEFILAGIVIGSTLERLRDWPHKEAK